MNEKNVVLLGESHFAFKNGITQGILDTGFKCFNLSLGGTPSLQNLYELIRNKKLLENADLIITGSNTHDIAQYNSIDLFPKSYQAINWLYKELYFLKKKIICFIAPTPQKWLNKNCVKYVNTLHIKLAIKYGFNVININKKHLESSYSLIQRDEAHDFDFIMRELGRNIANNIENFSFPKKINIINDNPQFYFYPIEKAINLNFANFKFKQSWLCSEKVYCIKSKKVISFNKNTFNLNLLGIHLWNDSGICEIQIKNPKDQIFNRSLDSNFSYFFDIYDRQFKFTNDTKILNNGVNNINLISFFLASPEGNYHTEEIDLEALANENIEIPKEYNFNHLIPPIKLYKEIIDEYYSIMVPVKLAPLQNQIKEKNNIISTLNQEKTTLQNELNSLPAKKQRLELANLEQDLKNKELQSFVLKKELGNKFVKNININYIDKNSAKARIQNHLSYKLGQALIENSKSIFGYIRIPYVLSYIKDKHKFEQKAYEEKIKENPNLALPPLETYPDYNEALKEKECFTYKLGEALMQANKNWYGGGYIKFIFKDVPRLKREFRKR